MHVCWIQSVPVKYTCLILLFAPSIFTQLLFFSLRFCCRKLFHIIFSVYLQRISLKLLPLIKFTLISQRTEKMKKSFCMFSFIHFIQFSLFVGIWALMDFCSGNVFLSYLCFFFQFNLFFFLHGFFLHLYVCISITFVNNSKRT